MLWNRIYKIKNSIDVYLVDEEYVLFYFMNTRARKRFRVNETVIKLIEEIDGERTADALFGCDGHRSFHVLQQYLADGKPQACPLDA